MPKENPTQDPEAQEYRPYPVLTASVPLPSAGLSRHTGCIASTQGMSIYDRSGEGREDKKGRRERRLRSLLRKRPSLSSQSADKYYSEQPTECLAH